MKKFWTFFHKHFCIVEKGLEAFSLQIHYLFVAISDDDDKGKVFSRKSKSNATNILNVHFYSFFNFLISTKNKAKYTS